VVPRAEKLPPRQMQMVLQPHNNVHVLILCASSNQCVCLGRGEDLLSSLHKQPADIAEAAVRVGATYEAVIKVIR